jgi:hypothetical protein
MVEGKSLRAISRIHKVSINTVSKLLVDVGQAAMKFHDQTVRGLQVQRLQCSEICVFIGAKQKNVKDDISPNRGDWWNWVGIDVHTKLLVSYLLARRDSSSAFEFMEGCASRIDGRLQVNAAGHHTYLQAVEGAWGMDVDYPQLQKLYGESSDTEQWQYNSARCIGSDQKALSDNPDQENFSKCFSERKNLAKWVGMRHFIELPSRFSNKLYNYAYAIAIHFLHYNFATIHKTLRITPAMAAGISARVWSLEEIVGLACQDTTRKHPEHARALNRGFEITRSSQ